MNTAKRQTLAMIGISFLVIAAIFIYVGMSQPRVYEPEASTSQQTESTAEVTASSAYTSGEYSAVCYPVNLNTATYDELVSIEGIGDVRANQILQYREQIGGYTSVDQIKDISGIGDTIYNQVSPYLTV